MKFEERIAMHGVSRRSGASLWCRMLCLVLVLAASISSLIALTQGEQKPSRSAGYKLGASADVLPKNNH